MLLSSGQACSYPMKATHAKYGGFAYSSAYGYSVPPGLFSLEQYALASQLGLSDDGGEYWKTRRTCEYSAMKTQSDDTPTLVSIWRPFPDVRIKTILVPPSQETPNWHLRAHKIEAGREVMTADGGFAIRNVNSKTGRYLDLYDGNTHEGTSPQIIGNYDLDTPAAWAQGSEGSFAVCIVAGASGVKALEGGLTQQRRANLVNADPNSNLLESRTTIPTLQHKVKKGETSVYVTGVYAKPTGPKESFLNGWEKPPTIPGWLEAELTN